MRLLISCRKEKSKVVARRMSRGRSIEEKAAVQKALTHCMKGNMSVKPLTGNQYPCRNESSGVCLPKATGMGGQGSGTGRQRQKEHPMLAGEMNVLAQCLSPGRALQF